jgi:MFS family permease
MVPWVIRRFGHLGANLMAAVLTIAGFAGLAAPLSLGVVASSTVVMGLGLIVRWITCDTLVVHVANEATRGRVIGLHEALMGLGIGLGPLLFTGLDLTPIAMVSILLALVAAFSFVVAGSAPSERNRKHEDEAPGHDRAGAIAVARSYFGLIALALVAAFIAGFVENSSVAMFPLNLLRHGYELSASAVMVSAFGFGGTLLQPLLGAIADRRGYGFAQALCAVTVIASCGAIAAFTALPPVLLVAMFFLGGAAGGFNTLAVIEAGQRLDTQRIPAAMTAIAMMYTIGSIGGPIAAGAVMDQLANTGMLALFAAAGAGFVLFLWLRRA